MNLFLTCTLLVWVWQKCLKSSLFNLIIKFTFSHLADTFIQSDLYTVFMSQMSL